jgi:hypothetical protein
LELNRCQRCEQFRCIIFRLVFVEVPLDNGILAVGGVSGDSSAGFRRTATLDEVAVHRLCIDVDGVAIDQAIETAIRKNITHIVSVERSNPTVGASKAEDNRIVTVRLRGEGETRLEREKFLEEPLP